MGLFDFLKPQKPRTGVGTRCKRTFVPTAEGPLRRDEQKRVGLRHRRASKRGEFGLAATNPIPTKTIFGSTYYLSLLCATDGAKVSYERRCAVSGGRFAVADRRIRHQAPRRPATRRTVFFAVQRRILKAPRGFRLAALAHCVITPIKCSDARRNSPWRPTTNYTCSSAD